MARPYKREPLLPDLRPGSLEIMWEEREFNKRVFSDLSSSPGKVYEFLQPRLFVSTRGREGIEQQAKVYFEDFESVQFLYALQKIKTKFGDTTVLSVSLLPVIYESIFANNLRHEHSSLSRRVPSL